MLIGIIPAPSAIGGRATAWRIGREHFSGRKIRSIQKGRGTTFRGQAISLRANKGGAVALSIKALRATAMAGRRSSSANGVRPLKKIALFSPRCGETSSREAARGADFFLAEAILALAESRVRVAGRRKIVNVIIAAAKMAAGRNGVPIRREKA